MQTLIAITALQSMALAQQGNKIETCESVAVQVKNGSNPAASSRPAPEKSARAGKTEIDARIPHDPSVNKMLEPYRARVRELDTVIGRLNGDLKKEGMGAGSLGNFVSDGIRTQLSDRLGKPIVLVVTNSGGLRRNTIAEGELRARDIFELLPFENALVEIDLTGPQLLRLLRVVVANRDVQSGAQIRYRANVDNKREFVSAKLMDKNGHEKEIEPKTTYTIVTIDYFLKLASGSYAILREGKNVKSLGVTIREAIMDYVKAETAAGRPIKAKLDRRFVLEGPGLDKEDEQR